MEVVCPTTKEFFLYGLVYFILGILLYFNSRQMEEGFIKKLWLLAIFALIKGIAEWQHLFYPLLMDQLDLEVLKLNLGHRLLITLAYTSLLGLGIEGLGHQTGLFKHFRIGFVIILTLWFLYVFNFTGAYKSQNIVQWSAMIENGGKYFLALPGGILAGIAFWLQGSKLCTNRVLIVYAKIISISLCFYGLVVALFAFPVSVFPSNIINRTILYDKFFIKGEQIEIFLGLILMISLSMFLGEVKKIYHQRKQYLAKQEAIQNERDRISRELHDGIIQSIYGIMLKLEHMKFTGGKNSNNLDDIKRQLNIIINDLRQYIYNNIESDLRFENLNAGFTKLVQEFKNISGIEVHYIYNETDNLKLDKEIVANLYFVLKEGLINILKHSQATKVSINVEKFSSAIRVAISDNGIGLTNKKYIDGKGMGLNNIKNRTKKLGGEANISSGIDGTKIEINVPLRRNHGDEKSSISR